MKGENKLVITASVLVMAILLSVAWFSHKQTVSLISEKNKLATEFNQKQDKLIKLRSDEKTEYINLDDAQNVIKTFVDLGLNYSFNESNSLDFKAQMRPFSSDYVVNQLINSNKATVSGNVMSGSRAHYSVDEVAYQGTKQNFSNQQRLSFLVHLTRTQDSHSETYEMVLDYDFVYGKVTKYNLYAG